MQFNSDIMSANSSIKSYNKFLQKEMQTFDINLDNQGLIDFDNVLNAQLNSANSIPQGPIISSGIQMNVGLENIGITPIDRMDSTSSSEGKKRESMSAVEKTASDIGKGFSNALNQVNDSQHAAYNAAETFASGGDISVHEVMLASQKANLTMQMALQLRNRMVNAYNEINNVRV